MTYGVKWTGLVLVGVCSAFGEMAPAALPPSPDATVTVDLTCRRAIGGISGFDRETWFGVYLEPGYATTLVEVNGVRKSVDTWIRDEGNMMASRGTVGFRKYWKNGGYVLFTEDPNRPGFIDPQELARYVGTPERYVIAKQLNPNHKTILSGEGHGEFPDFMCWPTNLTHGVNTVSNHAAHAEAVIATFRRIEQAGGLMPRWYEVLNESTVQSNFGWHHDPDAWDKLAEFHNAVAEAMAVAYPQVKVAGPTDAWPYVDGSSGNFSPWLNENKKFIHLSGDKLGAYSFHPYELDFAVTEGQATIYDAQFVSRYVWSKGRLESFIDLWENEHWLKWGDFKPFVISEYGALEWGETNQFNYVKSCNAMLVAVMDRPDIIDKMSVFILPYARWNPSSRLTFFTSDDGGRTYHPTPFMNYLRFWKDLQGEYVFASSDNYHLLSRAFITNNVAYVLLHNNYRAALRVDLQPQLPAGARVVRIQRKMLFQNGRDLGFSDYTPLPSLTNLTVPAEATCILRLTLRGMPELPVVFEDNYYGNKVLEDINAGADERFLIQVTKPLDHQFVGARLHPSLYRPGGFTYNPAHIWINGVRLPAVPDLTHSAGVMNCWKQFSVDVPAPAIAQGVNLVSVIFPQSGGKITSVRLAVVSKPAPLRLSAEALPASAGQPGIRLHFPTTRGRRYYVLRTTTLNGTPNWGHVTTVPGTGDMATVDDTGTGLRFYQVKVTAAGSGGVR